MKTTLGQMFLTDLESEVLATRKCLERIPESLFPYKPHEKSMKLGYLTLLVADIPRWISAMVEIGEINFATWERYNPTTTADVLKRFDENMAMAKKALAAVSDEELEDGMFYLKSGEQELMKSSKIESVSSTLRHWAHHRGQLTVYMRLNDILVPAIYGPSADDKNF